MDKPLNGESVRHNEIVDFKNKFDEIYFKAIDDLQKTPEYEITMSTILTLRKMLIRMDKDSHIVDMLIEKVTSSVEDEYHFALKRITEYANENLKMKKFSLTQKNGKIINIP